MIRRRITILEPLTEYRRLLNMSYDELVGYLKSKYGQVKDDYYKEKSYTRFLKGEIKSPTKGNFSNTLNGLYCHHINEDKILNLTNPNYYKDYKVPFINHQRDNLVYCDLIEHLILHATIRKESNNELSNGGYETILGIVIDWFYDENKPRLEWMVNCFNKSFLKKEDVKTLILELDIFLNEQRDLQNYIYRLKDPKFIEKYIPTLPLDTQKVVKKTLITIEQGKVFPCSTIDLIEISKVVSLDALAYFENRRLENERISLEFELKQGPHYKAWVESEEKRKEERELEEQKFIKIYPNLSDLGVKKSMTRKKINALLYGVKSFRLGYTQKEFTKITNKYTLRELLEAYEQLLAETK